MPEYTPMADDRRPSVRLLMTQAAGIDLQAVFCGLEEEGIPIEVQEVPGGEAIALSKEAAHMSPLNVGLGVNGVQRILALHHRDLPVEHPLFVIGLGDANSGELRRLGINAARLVKGEPLVLEDESVVETDDPPGLRGVGTAHIPDDFIERIVQSVLQNLAKA